MKSLVLSLALSLHAAAFFAQSSFTGKITDETNQPLPYANVVLLSLPDSAFVTGTVSDAEGRFALQATKANLLLRVSSIGYATLYNKVEKNDLGILQLHPETQLLGEVTVKGDLPKMRQKGDAIVTTVEGSILEKAGTGNDLLDKIPGVSADNGSVSVFGAGTPEIYINGRKVRDNSELDQLSSDNIKSVEVVNNPGARYDASVNAVIRIRTKRQQGEGFGFNNRFYTAYQYDWTTLDQFNFNYRKDGFDLSGLLFGLDKRGEDNLGFGQKIYLDKNWEQDTKIWQKKHEQNLTAIFSLNYQFNENHSIGLRYNFNRTPRDLCDVNVPTLILQNHTLYETSQSTGIQSTPEFSHTLNTYYSGEVNGWSLDFNADGLWMDKKTLENIADRITPVEGVQEEETVISRNREENRLYAAKFVIGHSLWGGNFSLGGEYTYTNRDNRYRNIEGFLEDSDSRIRENAIATFLEYSRRFGKLEARAGVRYEHLVSDYYEEGVRVDEQSRTYDNVFPSLSLSLPIGKTQLSLSYSSKIERPTYFMLRSNTTYDNHYLYESGNPFLVPSIANHLTLDVSYKWLYLNVYYDRQNDIILQCTQPYSESSDPTVSTLTYYNMNDADRFGASIVLAPTIGIWSPQWTLALDGQKYNVETPKGTVNFNNPMGFFKWSNNFQLPKGFVLDVEWYGMTPGQNKSTEQREFIWATDISLLKSFFNNQLTFQLQANDLFNTITSPTDTYNGNRIMTWDGEAMRSFSLTVRYSFNATKSKYKGTGAGQEQRSRM